MKRKSIEIYFRGRDQIEAVDVAELTIKIVAVSSEELYYGFAEEDEIIFSFEELKGKPLKEFEIATNSKFMNFNV